MRYGSWDRQNFLSFWAIFYPFYPPNNPENQNFETIKEASWDVIILHMCTNNHDHMMYAPWDMECNRHHFLSLWVIFCPFTPLLTPKIKIWKKCKQIWRYCPFKHMMYGSWEKIHDGHFFVILDHFLPFDPPNNPKNQNFEKMKKMPGDIIILHLCSINDNHMMLGSWDMELNRQNCLSFWAIFCPFTPLTTEKSIFWK